jgi:hypothetical protein
MILIRRSQTWQDLLNAAGQSCFAQRSCSWTAGLHDAFSLREEYLGPMRVVVDRTRRVHSLTLRAIGAKPMPLPEAPCSHDAASLMA